MKRLLIVAALVAAPLACTFTTTRPAPTVGAAPPASTSGPTPVDDAATAASTDAAAGGTGASEGPGAGASGTSQPAEPGAAAGTGSGASGGAEPLGPPPCTQGAPSLKPEATITLVSPGAEPRKELRYRPRVGTRGTLVYELNTTMNVAQGGKSAQKASVGFTLYLAARVVESDEERSRFEFKVTRLVVPDVPNMPLEFTKGVRKELSAWKNVSGAVVVDALGLTQDVNVKGAGQGLMAASRANDIRVALEQTPNPLPKEPVGVGAKWQLQTVVDTGLVLRGKTTFELTHLRNDRGTVRFLIDQHSDPKPGPAVCPQEGIVVQPLSWNATGRGERTFELARLIAGKYQTELRVVNESRLWLKGKPQLQQVKIEMGTKMSTL